MKMPLWMALLLAGPLCAQTPDPAQPAWERLQAAVVEQSLEIDSSDPRCQQLTQLGDRLTSTQRRYPVKWHFAVVRSPRPDAGCTGEGAVYVTTGLLDLELEQDELAGILGHEIAHGLLRHVEANQQLARQAEEVRAQQRQAQQQVAQLERERDQMEESAYQKARADLLQRARQLKSQIDSLKAQAWTARGTLQSQEDQADSVGLQMAKRAGFQSDGLLRALRRLQSIPSLKDELGGFRHPPLEQRIESLEKLLQESETGTSRPN